MSFQTTDVQCVIIPNGTYVLTAPLIYVGQREVFVVPAGFRTDLASVPRALTWLVPIAGVHNRAAIVHDYLCVELDRAYVARPAVVPVPASPRDADGIFRRILRELGVPFVTRWLFYVGVRWGALLNPARRVGFWRDAPLVLAISAVVLAPIVVVVFVLVRELTQ